MSVRVEESLVPELERFGAADVSACFNCGTCSAICPMTGEGGAFPRRMIRYVQLGMRDQLLASPELWTCYQCGECTESCPRQADPAGFMAAARRYAVASNDRTGLARRLALSATFGVAFTVALVAVLAAFMYTAHRPVAGDELALFRFLPATLVHDLGVGILIAFGVAAVAGIVSMTVRLRRRGEPDQARPRSPGRIRDALWYAIGRESLGQVRFRAECREHERRVPWYLRRWFVHAATMWGFLGLLAATLLDYGLELAGVRPTGASVPIWYPVRLLGTVAGVLLMYGATVSILRRLTKAEASVQRSTSSDWTFLGLLWVSGMTGFAIELALYLPRAPGWGYGVFLLHVAAAMALVLLAPFGKFAHAIHRPAALFVIRMRRSEAGATS